MNKIIKNIWYQFCSSWEYKAVLAYLLLGILFFSVKAYHLSYFEIFASPYVNFIFLGAFFYPSFLFVTIWTFDYINNIPELTLRLKNRKQYAWINIISVLVITSFLFLNTLLMSGILSNLFSNRGLIMTYNLSYNTADHWVYIISLIKVFLTILSLSFCYITCSFFSNKKNLAYF